VKEYVPPASLSSVSSAAAKETGRSSETLNILLSEGEEKERKGGKGEKGVVGGVASGLGSVVGMDEPPEA
jgi:hypothetical protein